MNATTAAAAPITITARPQRDGSVKHGARCELCARVVCKPMHNHTLVADSAEQHLAMTHGIQA